MNGGSLYPQLLETLYASETLDGVPVLPQLNNGSLPFDYLLEVELRLEAILSNSSLPLRHVRLKLGFVGMPHATLHGSSSTGEGRHSGEPCLQESSSELAGYGLEELDAADLGNLVKVLGILSTVRYSTNPKRINLFTIGTGVTYNHLHRYLFDLLYTLSYDTAPPSGGELGKMLKVIQAYLLMVATPGSREHDLVSTYAINWIVSLLRDMVGTLPPHGSFEGEVQAIETCLVLLVKVVLDHVPLHGLGAEVVNFLGLWCAADPFKPNFPLATCAYRCLTWILETSYFAYREVFPHILKWLCFNMRKVDESQLATAFLTSSLDLMVQNGCLDFLMHFIKHIISDLNDRAAVKAATASNLAKVLASLDYPEAQHILENLLKDCIQAASARTRAAAVDIFEAWMGVAFSARPESAALRLASYAAQELQDLAVALMDLVFGRLLDRTQLVRSRAIAAYLNIVTKVQIRARRANPRLEVAQSLMLRLVNRCDDRFAGVLARCSGDLNPHIRQAAIQLFAFFLNRQLMSDATCDAFLSATLAAYIQQCQDPAWRVRRTCIASVAHSIRIAFQPVDASSSSRALGALWQLWVEYALPAMFDPEKAVVELTFLATVEFLQGFSRDATFAELLGRFIPELSLKGMRQVFFLLAERAAIQRNLAPNQEASAAQASLLECPRFMAFLISEVDGRPGLWQLAAAISAHAQLGSDRMEVMPRLLQAWSRAKACCGATLRSVGGDWILVGSSILTVLYNLPGLEVPSATLGELAQYLLSLEAPVQWVHPILRLLQRWDAAEWPAPPGEAAGSFEEFAVALMRFGCKVCRRTAKQLERSDSVPLQGALLAAVCAATFIIGELCLVVAGAPAEEGFKVLLGIVGQLRPGPTPTFLFPHHVRALAFVSVGKLALVHEAFAKRLIPAIASELDLQPLIAQRAREIPLDEVFTLEAQGGAWIQHSALVVFADLCLRYTSAADDYLPLVANCLRHPHAAVRQKAFLMFTRLLRGDFIKWRGHLPFKFLVALVMEPDASVREFAYYCFVHVLLVKASSLLLDKLVGLVLFVNGYHPPQDALQLPPTEEESLLFTFPGCHEVRRGFRCRCYKFLLEHLTPEQRFRATHVICRQLLAPAAEGTINLRSALGQNVLEDALHILGSEEIQLPALRPDEGELDLQDQPKVKLLSSINLHNAIVNIIPTILQLKATLVRHHSPLQGALMGCLARIIANYRVDTECLLATVDAKHVDELRYDLARLQRLATNKKRRTEPHLNPNQSTVGPLADTPLRTKPPTVPPNPPTNCCPPLNPTSPACSTPLPLAKGPAVMPFASPNSCDILTSTPRFPKPSHPLPLPRPRSAAIQGGLPNGPPAESVTSLALTPDLSSYLAGLGSPILADPRIRASPVFATLDEFDLPPPNSPALQLSRRAWANQPGNLQTGVRVDALDPEAQPLRLASPSPSTPPESGCPLQPL
ncbi:Condensin-2 complex subunit D3 [Massospora cicadina]|nr:Condensin-2 complex subunit D3 [Massospora cicadina]